MQLLCWVLYQLLLSLMPEWTIRGCASQEVIPFATLTLELVITFFWTSGYFIVLLS